MLHTTDFDHKTVWTIVKDIRKSKLYDYSKVASNIDCTFGLVSDVEDNVRKLEERLNLNINNEIIENVSDRTLQLALEMFTYLNYCPPHTALQSDVDGIYQGSC